MSAAGLSLAGLHAQLLPVGRLVGLRLGAGVGAAVERRHGAAFGVGVEAAVGRRVAGLELSGALHLLQSTHCVDTHTGAKGQLRKADNMFHTLTERLQVRLRSHDVTSASFCFIQSCTIQQPLSLLCLETEMICCPGCVCSNINTFAADRKIAAMWTLHLGRVAIKLC